jgi:hypothetical protein
MRKFPMDASLLGPAGVHEAMADDGETAGIG